MRSFNSHNDDINYQRHVTRLAQVKPTIKTSQGYNHMTNSHTKMHQKVNKALLVQQQRTQQENIRLVQKIQSIHNNTNKSLYNNTIHRNNNIPHKQPHVVQRQKQLYTQCIDNERLVHRLLSVEPVIKRNEQLINYSIHQKYVQTHCKHTYIDPLKSNHKQFIPSNVLQQQDDNHKHHQSQHNTTVTNTTSNDGDTVYIVKKHSDDRS